MLKFISNVFAYYFDAHLIDLHPHWIAILRKRRRGTSTPRDSIGATRATEIPQPGDSLKILVSTIERLLSQTE